MYTGRVPTWAYREAYIGVYTTRAYREVYSRVHPLHPGYTAGAPSTPRVYHCWCSSYTPGIPLLVHLSHLRYTAGCTSRTLWYTAGCTSRTLGYTTVVHLSHLGYTTVVHLSHPWEREGSLCEEPPSFPEEREKPLRRETSRLPEKRRTVLKTGSGPRGGLFALP